MRIKSPLTGQVTMGAPQTPQGQFNGIELGDPNLLRALESAQG